MTEVTISSAIGKSHRMRRHLGHDKPEWKDGLWLSAVNTGQGASSWCHRPRGVVRSGSCRSLAGSGIYPTAVETRRQAVRQRDLGDCLEVARLQDD